MKLYIAGPMTGLPQFNFPAFEAMTDYLRVAGFDVVSPHEEDDPDVQEAAWASPDGDLSKLPQGRAGSDPVLTATKNISDIGRCDGIALLDDWQKSSGTVHEVATAVRFKMPVAPAALWLAAGNEEASIAFELPEYEIPLLPEPVFNGAAMDPIVIERPGEAQRHFDRTVRVEPDPTRWPKVTCQTEDHIVRGAE